MVKALLHARHFDTGHIADELEAFSTRSPDFVRSYRVVRREEREAIDALESLDVLAARPHSYRRLIRKLLDSRDEVRLGS